MTPDTRFILVWRIWRVLALMTLPYLLQIIATLSMPEWESVPHFIGVACYTLLIFTSLLYMLGRLPLLIVSPLYVCLFCQRRAQGVPMSARFWVPIWTSVVLAVFVLLRFW